MISKNKIKIESKMIYNKLKFLVGVMSNNIKSPLFSIHTITKKKKKYNLFLILCYTNKGLKEGIL